MQHSRLASRKWFIALKDIKIHLAIAFAKSAAKKFSNLQPGKSLVGQFWAIAIELSNNWDKGDLGVPI